MTTDALAADIIDAIDEAADPQATEQLPKYEALANQIAAKHGLKHMPWRVREIVAIYDFLTEIVDADNIPIVLALAVEKTFTS